MKKCLIPANNRKNLKKSFLLGAFGIIWGPVQAQHNAVELRAVHNQRIRRQGLKPQQCKKSLNFRSFQVNVIAVSTEATFRLPAVQSNWSVSACEEWPPRAGRIWGSDYIWHRLGLVVGAQRVAVKTRFLPYGKGLLSVTAQAQLSSDSLFSVRRWTQRRLRWSWCHSTHKCLPSRASCRGWKLQTLATKNHCLYILSLTYIYLEP